MLLSVKDFAMQKALIIFAAFATFLGAERSAAQITVDPNGNVKPTPVCVVQTDGTCTPVTSANPLPTSGGGGGGGSVPTGTAGAPNAAVVTVQGIAGGVAQPVSGTITVSNSGFASFGSAGTAYQQGTGASGTNAQNVYIGGQNAALSVTGAFFQATQPVSNAGTFAVQNTASTPTGTNSIGTVGLNAGSNAIGSITNSSFAVTQATAASLNATVVGTGTFATQVTSSALPTGAATSANQTNGTQLTGLTTGANVIGATVGYVGYDDSTTNLASSGTFFGAVRSPPASWAMSFQCRAYAESGGGTLYVAESVGGTGKIIGTATLTAGSTATVIVTVLGATTSYQCQYANGGTAQTYFRLNSAFLNK